MIFRQQGTLTRALARLLAIWMVLWSVSQVAYADEVTFVLNDAQGSPVVQLNSVGEVISREHYDPWGKRLEGNTGEIGYTGHEFDAETGLTYMQARYYDPEVGRFLAIDPIGFIPNQPMTFNRYSYANNSPYIYTDPTGMAGCSDMSSQGLSGYCVDSSNFKDGADSTTTVSDAKTDDVARESLPSLKSKGSEKGGYFTKGGEGDVSFTQSPSQTELIDNTWVTTFSVPDSATAIGHSHPDVGSSIKPGPADDGPVNNGKPNYIYQKNRIVVVEKSGGQYRVRVVKGHLDFGDRISTKKELNIYQERGK